MKRTKRILAALLSAILALTMLTACEGMLPPGFGDDLFPSDDVTDTSDPLLTEYRQQVLDLVNAARAENGVPALRMSNRRLNNAAQTRAAELVSSFSHTRPDGRRCFTVLDENYISYWACGENIAYGYSTPQQVMNGWMNSSGHRANILDPDFTEIGIGFVQEGRTCYWVQVFIG